MSNVNLALDEYERLISENKESLRIIDELEEAIKKRLYVEIHYPHILMSHSRQIYLSHRAYEFEAKCERNAKIKYLSLSVREFRKLKKEVDKS